MEIVADSEVSRIVVVEGETAKKPVSSASIKRGPPDSEESYLVFGDW